MNVYGKEFIEKYEIIEEKYRDDVDPDAKRSRDRRSRELRKAGYIVESKKWDMPTCTIYTIYAKKERVA
jgi:hypothetical protein